MSRNGQRGGGSKYDKGLEIDHSVLSESASALRALANSEHRIVSFLAIILYFSCSQTLDYSVLTHLLC